MFKSSVLPTPVNARKGIFLEKSNPAHLLVGNSQPHPCFSGLSHEVTEFRHETEQLSIFGLCVWALWLFACAVARGSCHRLSSDVKRLAFPQSSGFKGLARWLYLGYASLPLGLWSWWSQAILVAHTCHAHRNGRGRSEVQDQAGLQSVNLFQKQTPKNKIPIRANNISCLKNKICDF